MVLNDYQQALKRAQEDRNYLRSVISIVGRGSMTGRACSDWFAHSLLNDEPISEQVWKLLVPQLIRLRRLKRCDSALVRGAVERLLAARAATQGDTSC